MDLLATFENLVALGNQNPSPVAWQRAKDAFARKIDQMDRADELLATLKADSGDVMPIDLKRRLYSRCIVLDPDNAVLLREYAWYLELHGPDWDDEAAILKAKAAELESGG